MDYLVSFGEWLRERREALRLTRPELADCAGCSVSALRKIEADERRPSRELAELLGRCLHIPAEGQLVFVEAARGLRPVARLGRPTGLAALESPTPPRSAAAASSAPPVGPAWNLPAPATPLVGREAELATLTQLLTDPGCRLLTVVGPGGIGKTRLAVEAACYVWERFADGIFFASLATTSSPEFMVPAIGQAVGLDFSGRAEPRRQLASYLSNRQLLLLLDNLEHLLEGVDLVAELLARAPELKLLATSRERLALSGEWVFEVQGLPVPAEGEAEALEKYSAAQLFLQRARRAQVDFGLSAEDRPEVVRICRLVEGMPLAIELAAAWVTVLSCAAIADEIERGLDILRTTLRDVPKRQRSMRAVFEHSWELLAEEEQLALCQLSLFRGGFQRDAAQAVGGANLPVLSALFSKSLLRRNESGRYDLHELIRQCALEHLERDSALWAETKERYVAFHMALAETADEQLRGAEQLQWLERLEQEHDNLRVALDWLLAADSPAADHDMTPALQLASALRWFWHMRGHFHEGRDWLTKMLQRRPQRATAVRARALVGAGLLSNHLGQHEAAVVLAEESV
ncbi:MAG: helix-turn-helix domain-containing protein, partial [Anaerolineae bacterium]|nr:helix-turn-helix domain-containing protein [Anaerolineae bacterium]